MVFVSSGHLVDVYVLKNLGAICGYASKCDGISLGLPI
jgi:hypothetical protein